MSTKVSSLQRHFLIMHCFIGSVVLAMLASFFMLQVMVLAGRCNLTPLVGSIGTAVQALLG